MLTTKAMSERRNYATKSDAMPEHGTRSEKINDVRTRDESVRCTTKFENTKLTRNNTQQHGAQQESVRGNTKFENTR